MAVDNFPWDYKHCTDDTLVCDHRCVLHAVVINKCATGAVSVTIYDNTEEAGTDIVAIIDIDNGKTHYVDPVTLFYDVQCENGIYAAFSAASGDITVTYK